MTAGADWKCRGCGSSGIVSKKQQEDMKIMGMIPCPHCTYPVEIRGRSK